MQRSPVISICVWGKLGQGNPTIIATLSFSKSSMFKYMFRKAGVFEKRRFRKAAFSWRISVDGRPNRRNKAAFSWRISADGRPNRRNKAAFLNSYGVVWTRPWSGLIMGMFLRGDGLSLISICEISKVGIFQAAYSSHSRSRKRLRIL